ncbi:2-dehydro-3-deoxygluconokinase [Salmonella enterica subsp. diarizonae]|uniref:2-dehydro-3-deoxygluconokinase n=1 Tax=Salmonella diarizonae TaxID=59204 RepID=A0A379TT15_SALDZ|nr:2-dehydro-3-deoxygluconokinase [Salmonella enterica subsp. diarizonae]
MSKKIAVIGECMIELSQKGADVQRGFGGDTLNTSIYIARQVDSAALTVHYVTALGTDSFSQQMLEAWQHENVDTSLTQRMEIVCQVSITSKPTTLASVPSTTGVTKRRRNSGWESEQTAAICKSLATFDYLYLSGISLAILSPASRDKLLSLLRECRDNGGKVIFDNNYRPRLWTSREETQQVYQKMLECTDIAFLTLDDEDALWGKKPVEEVIARTHATGVQEVVVKRGADSCLVSIQGEALIDVPAVKLPKEKVIDTTAAGDSFSAGYLAVRLSGGSATDAAKRGHLTASTVIQYRGAIIPHDAMPQ